MTSDDKKRIEDLRTLLSEQLAAHNCMSGELLTCAFLLAKLDEAHEALSRICDEERPIDYDAYECWQECKDIARKALGEE